MNKFLYVLFENKVVGIITQLTSGALNFSYEKSWLESNDAFPISFSMPLTSDIFPDSVTRSYFAGLLPEGKLREDVARKLGISARSDFKLLESLGGDCAGALVLSTTLDMPSQGKKFISKEDLSQILKNYIKQPFLTNYYNVRLSLAGSQEKLPIIYENGEFYLPQGLPSTHILKLPIASYDNTVLNEAFCLKLAKKVGIDTVSADILTLDKTDYLLVERYDRVRNGAWKRIHQEDACQALCISSENKYQKEGGPSVNQVIDLIKTYSDVPVKDIDSFLKQFIFNFYMGNRDAHGKNYSFILGKFGSRLSPLYDVLCTQIYAGLSKEMAMKLGKTYNPGLVTDKDWDLLAESNKINRVYLADLRGELFDSIYKNLNTISEDLAKYNAEFVKEIIRFFKTINKNIYSMKI